MNLGGGIKRKLERKEEKKRKKGRRRTNIEKL
jgi:hypothetical protein